MKIQRMIRPLASCTLSIALWGMAAAQTKEIPLERLKYNHPGLEVDLGVGLWGWPIPFDYDDDGDRDLVVSCSDVPFNGTYFFENPGTGDAETLPVMKPPVKIGPGVKNIHVSFVAGQPRVLVPGAELIGIVKGDFQSSESIDDRKVFVPRDRRVRANQWGYVDFDGDGALDVFAGHGWWSDYGWDDAFNEDGKWVNGPLHGNVFLLRNLGSTEEPEYAPPEQLATVEGPVDVYGMPSPNFADFDSDGDLDLICGDFLDGFTYFQNLGSRTEPKYAAGRELMTASGSPLNMPLCMIVVSAVDWDDDGHVDLVVGQEDGRVAMIRHSGSVRQDMPLFDDPVFFRQQADEVKFGALVTPVSHDWDQDGDEDLLCGNTAGEIALIENLDGSNPPKWAAPVLLQADGQPIRIMAGPTGSIQGPAEAKWGYTTISVADWDHDGRTDVIANSIWGKVVWFRNVGQDQEPKLAPARPIIVSWQGDAPKPAWNWWDPEGGELVTQWRTTPSVEDFDGDGLNDLVMLDHEGYLSWFRRKPDGDDLILQPGQRIFGGGSFDRNQKPVGPRDTALRLNTETAGKSGRRKICIVDWDGDGIRDLLVNSRNVNWMRGVDSQHFVRDFVDQGMMSDRRLAGHTTSPTTTDWDNDGKRELLVGAEDGFLYYQRTGK